MRRPKELRPPRPQRQIALLLEELRSRRRKNETFRVRGHERSRFRFRPTTRESALAFWLATFRLASALDRAGRVDASTASVVRRARDLLADTIRRTL